MARCLNLNTHYIFVVGNSSISNIFFNTADFLTEIAERNGFKIYWLDGYAPMREKTERVLTLLENQDLKNKPVKLI